MRAAYVLAAQGLFAPACFHAQQCGEKAIKALWYLEDLDPWGHSILKLVLDFPHHAALSDASQWEQDARILDQFYVPTSYPNGLPDPL